MGPGLIRLTRRPLLFAIVPAAILCAPASALAVNLYAAPTATGAMDCSTPANACTLQTALADVGTDQTIVVAGDEGTYGTAGAPLGMLGLTFPGNYEDDGISITGAPGQPRPVIYTSGGLDMFCEYFNECGTVSDLEVVTTAYFGFQAAGNVDHVLVEDASSSGPACYFNAGGLPQTISDTVCESSGDVAAVETSGTTSTGGSSITYGLAFRDDTFYIDAAGGGAGAYLSADISGAGALTLAVTATNTIFHGATDIETDESESGGGTATVTMTTDHSNFATTTAQGGSTISSGAGDQTAAPRYVDAATGNFHEAPGSVTIDHGENNALNGSTDLDGNPRIIGATTDIGAYEAAEAPTLGPVSIEGIAKTSATAATSVNPNYSATTVTAYVGTSTTAEHALATVSAGAGLTAVAKTLALSGLKPGTLYHLHLVASNAVGSRSTGDQTFATAPGPGTIKFDSTKPKVKGRKAAIRLTCSKGSTGCHGTLTLTGKVKVGRHTVTRKLGHVKFALNAGQTKTFKVKLSSLAVKRLKAAAHRRLKVNAKLARSDHGSTQTQKLTLALAKKR